MERNSTKSSYVRRKTPGDTEWFVHDRFGMFIHWGLYALPARHEWIKNKELYFWNNVKDNVTEIEKGKSGKTVTFLAGDIVKDSVINIYGLSAVVSYFGEIDLNTTPGAEKYAKYDLNRDGKIDSKDVAYVLVSWGE